MENNAVSEAFYDSYIEAYKKVVNYTKKSEAKLILALITPLTDKKVKEWAEEEGYNLLAGECVKFYSEKVGL